jgi:hypothetical protein
MTRGTAWAGGLCWAVGRGAKRRRAGEEVPAQPTGSVCGGRASSAPWSGLCGRDELAVGTAPPHRRITGGRTARMEIGESVRTLSWRCPSWPGSGAGGLAGPAIVGLVVVLPPRRFGIARSGGRGWRRSCGDLQMLEEAIGFPRRRAGLVPTLDFRLVTATAAQPSGTRPMRCGR